MRIEKNGQEDEKERIKGLKRKRQRQEDKKKGQEDKKRKDKRIKSIDHKNGCLI
jgi:hypothetical protein